MQFEGQLARNAAEYVQQIAGNSRQQIGFDLYQMDPVTIDPHFYSVYGSSIAVQGGGGLLDMHKMQQLARAVNDSIYIGIGKVYEALVIGTAASIWGDIPYREAADSTIEVPAFDAQLQVYADVLAQLDSAVLFLAATPGAPNVGPPADNAELIYLDRGGNTAALAAVYTQVAHSLKARYYMHLAEVDPANYALALAEVPLGISAPANDMLWFHDQTPTGQNVWWQFMGARGDIAPGAALVEILKRRIARGNRGRGDGCGSTSIRRRRERPRRTSTATAQVARSISMSHRGSTTVMAPRARAPRHTRPSTSSTTAPILVMSGCRLSPTAETQLIGAEAAFQIGGQGAAQPFLDAARANRSYGARGATPIAFAPLASGAGYAGKHHGREVRDSLPQHRGMERLQADLFAGTGISPGLDWQHHAALRSDSGTPAVRDHRGERQSQHAERLTDRAKRERSQPVSRR